MPIQRKHTMHHSTIVDADPDTVWAVVRDAMQVVRIVSGHAARDVSWTEGGAVERVPARYDFTLVFNDGLVQQEVAGRDEVRRSQTYRAVAPTMGVTAYLATIRVRTITNDPNRSFFEWSRELTIAEDADPEVIEAIIAMMAKQTDAVRDHFAASGH
ncbi:SRPBCC family protein [Nocardia sp. CDC159]|uniref:SRPBCC family protein n=1 Tax=Nocardia pulmonis TaxID=2951408 RepID=A0A9X2EEH6_9NOCA|nr:MULTISPECIES: SRPBCC family protein [Nocardia]MCM6778865.1 SRPBCC family protein [Nocardia pulmonis]MCM6791754.1 SRPBCC family protein [Nocardia sp. CDC159]